MELFVGQRALSSGLAGTAFTHNDFMMCEVQNSVRHVLNDLSCGHQEHYDRGRETFKLTEKERKRMRNKHYTNTAKEKMQRPFH